jgi:hypothetical protein
MKRGFYILLSVCMITISCRTKPIDGHLKILGHSLGDTINSDFIEMEKFGENFGLVAFKADNRFQGRTIKNHLYEIYGTHLTDNEFKEVKKTLNKKLGIEPKHFIGKTHYGLEIKGEEFYWLDSVTNNEYSIGVNLRKDSIYSFNLTNELLTDSIGKRLIENYGEEEKIEIAKPE